MSKSDARYNMDKPQKRSAKWNKPDRKGQVLYDSTYMRHLEEQNSWKAGWCLAHTKGKGKWGVRV